MSFRLKDAMAGFGWAVAAVAFIAGSLFGDAAHPVDKLTPSAPVSTPCPAGWEYTAVRDHVAIESCSRDGWVVVLGINGFEYGLLTTDPNATPVSDPAKVPGWPAR